MNPHALFYLGRHAGRKRKRRALEIESSPSTLAIVPQQYPQSQSIHQIRQQVASVPQRGHSPPQRNQPSFQSPQHILAPIPHVSSLLQQNQYRRSCSSSTELDTANSSHNHITIPKLVISSPSVLALSLLIYSLGCSQIPSDILFRGLLPQKRWDQYGNVREVLPQDAGFNEQIIQLFSSRNQLEQAIKSCIQLKSIVQDRSEDGEPMYSISDQSRHQICQSFKDEKELHLVGLMFITYIYPRDQTLEPS